MVLWAHGPSTAQESNLSAPTVRLFWVEVELQHVDVVSHLTFLAVEPERSIPNQCFAQFVALHVGPIVSAINRDLQVPALRHPHTIFDRRQFLDLVRESYLDWLPLCCHTFVLLCYKIKMSACCERYDMLGCMASDMRQEADAVIVGKLEDGMTFVDGRYLIIWSLVMYSLGLATAAVAIATLLG